ncbi:MAG: signal peptidase II, partial [Thermomicrobiales bacterium]
DLIGGVLGFEYVQNAGAAFGILAGQPLLLAIFAVLATGLFLAMMRTTLRTHALVPIAVGLVLGGAIGNLLDRIRIGYVVDFVAVGSFPRFNVADSAITIGLVLMAWAALREDATMVPEADHDPADTEPADPGNPPSSRPQSMRNGSHA